jgi:SpoVK/Ycf46/Vps4 family AAA+-type ATPase
MSHPLEIDEDLAALESFREALDACSHLYSECAEEWIRKHPNQLQNSAEETRALMQDLARGVVLKVFLGMVQADKRFSMRERRLAQLMLALLWQRHFQLEEVGEVLKELTSFNDRFTWYTLKERIPDLETAVMRLANQVAKVDGHIGEAAARQLKGVQVELATHLRSVTIEHDDDKLPGPRAAEIRHALESVPRLKRGAKAATMDAAPADELSPAETASREERLNLALKSLDDMIGLGTIKTEVKELARFLRVQQERARAGLPRTQISLHTIFAGNPGTGKTSVARVFGEVLGALGIVEKGHLVEADRSALVAGYTGQTAEKTNKVIDRALGGVLFIDEAYSLVAEEGEDAFGHEAVQTLLRRMEDDRDRLVVILAGYSRPVKRLLSTNPGLSSRFQRTFEFPDYTATELCQIFEAMCEKNHYTLPAATRARLLAGFHYLHTHRDERFGNGRLSRNVFEMAIRQLANRVADIAPFTKELLTRLEPEDIVIKSVPGREFERVQADDFRVLLTCPGCGQTSKLRSANLGRRVKCNKCSREFDARWGEII